MTKEAEKIEDTLRTSTTAAGPAEVSHVEASGSSGHTSKSTFTMMFDEVLQDQQESA